MFDDTNLAPPESTDPIGQWINQDFQAPSPKPKTTTPIGSLVGAAEEHFSNPETILKHPDVENDVGSRDYAERAGETLRDMVREKYPNFTGGSDLVTNFKQQIRAKADMAKLAQERENFRGAEETNLAWLHRHATPTLPFLPNKESTLADNYNEAVGRLKAGQATATDYKDIAAYERLNKIDQEGGTWGDIKRGLAGATKLTGEALIGGKVIGLAGKALGIGGAAAAEGAGAVAPQTLGGAAASLAGTTAKLGAQTVLTPSLWEGQAKANAEQNGGSPNDFKNLAPAIGLGMIQTAILGQLSGTAGKIGGAGVLPYLGRVATKTATGLVEQQAVDVLAGATGLQTGFGVLGDLAQGKGGDALRHLTVQAVTFGAFSAMHGGEEKPVLDAYTSALKDLQKNGYSADQAASVLSGHIETLKDVLNKNPGLTQEGAKSLFKDQPDGPLKDFAMSLADTLPEHPAPFKPEMPQKGALPPEAAHPEEAGPPPAPETVQSMVEGLPPEEVAEMQKYAQPSSARRLPAEHAEELLKQINEAAPPEEPQKAEQGKKLTEKEILQQLWESRTAEAGAPATPPSWGETYQRLRGEGKTHDQAAALADLNSEGGQEWQHSGTKFEGTDKNEFQAGDGKKYTIADKVYEPGSEKGGEHGAVRLAATDSEGHEKGVVVFDKQPDGRYLADAVLSTDIKGVARGLYDYLVDSGGKIVPSKKQSAGGKDFWRKNAEQAGRAPEIPAPTEAPLSPAAAQPAIATAEGVPTQPVRAQEALSRVERMRAKIGARQGTARPAPLAPVEQTLAGAAPRTAEEQAALGPSLASKQEPVPIHQASVNELKSRIDAGEGDLDPEQQDILQKRLAGVSLRDIAQEMGKSYESVRLREKAGLKKLGYTGSMNDFHTAGLAVRAVSAAENGDFRPGDEGLAVPGYESSRNERIKAISDAVEESNKFHDQYEKEKANGPLSAKREAYYREHFNRLRGIIDQGHEEAVEPQGRSAAEAGNGAEPSGETPVRPGGAAAIPEGGTTGTAGPAPEGTPPTAEGNAQGAVNAPAGGQAGGNELKSPLPRYLQKEMDSASTLKDRLHAAAEADTRVFDPIYGKAAWNEGGFETNEALRILEQRFDALKAGKDGPATVNDSMDATKRLIEKQIAALRKVGMDEEADWYERKGLPLIEEARKELGGSQQVGMEQKAVEIFNRLDQQKGGHNFVDMVDLRKGLAEAGIADRAGQDALIEKLRRAGVMTLSAIEGRGGVTPEQLRDAIREEGDKLGWVMLKDGWQEKLASLTKQEAAPKELAPGPVLNNAVNLLTGQLHENFDPQGGEVGGINVTRLTEAAKAAYEKLKAGVRGFLDHTNKLASVKFPKVFRLSAAAGNAAARFDSAPEYGRRSAIDYIDRVLGRDSTPEQAKLWGTTFLEERQRTAVDNNRKESAAFSYMAGQARAAGDQKAATKFSAKATERLQAALATEKAMQVGKQGSVLQSEADYQHVLNSPEYKAVMDRYQKELTPTLEDMFRRAEGMEDTDPIRSRTQIPGRPFTAKALEVGPPEPERIGSARGNVVNRRVPKLQAAQEAGLDADNYETDMREIINHTIQSRATLAAKAKMAKTLIEQGLAWSAKPGERVGNAERFDRVFPQKGTPYAPAGETDLWVTKDGDVNKEIRQVLQVDRPITLPIIKQAADASTWGSLISTLEAAYHAKNNLTFLFKPGVNPMEFARNIVRYVKDDPATMKRLVDLAEIGASQEGHRAATIDATRTWLPHPTSAENTIWTARTWTGRFLETIQSAMRLTADKAFDTLERQGRVEGSEENRRNFINQLGNYSKGSQSRLVVLLRDLGVGPFATAGTNYIMQGIRSVTGAPGVKATNWKQAVGLRAEQYARIATVVAATGLANYFKWGRLDGDDNTPLGHYKWGDLPNGKSSTIDFTAFTGLPRGMRQLGLLALAEGARKETPAGKQFDQAASSAGLSALHPAFGPLPSFVYTAATGRDIMGSQLATRVSTATTRAGIMKARLAGKPEAGSSQVWENLKASLWHAIPLAGTLAGQQRPGDEEKLIGERAADLLGPFGTQERGTAPKRRKIGAR